MNQRTEFVLRSYEPEVVFLDLCREYGISTKTGYKWRKRFEEDGRKGLVDQSRRPHSHSEELKESVVCEIIRLKHAHMRWGPRKIREVYLRGHGQAPSESSFKRVLDRAGLVKKRKKRPARQGDRIRHPVKAEKPNEIWTVDFKGWWKINNRQRCEPLTIRDEFSRYLFEIRAMKTSKTDPVRNVFEDVFSEYGLPGVIRSDNGSPFASSQAPFGLSRLSVWWLTLGIDLDRIEPGHPEQNGGHERMHLDIRRELQGMIEGDLTDHQAAFNTWRNEFNWERPHEALGMKVPGEVYHKSKRAFEAEGRDIEYPANMFTRPVYSTGMICLESQTIFLSESLRGVSVGIRPLPEWRYEVWLDHLNLGEIDITTATMNWRAPSSSSSRTHDKVLPMY